ncbi:hypothetical protein BaRGS_00034765 [Batillaria attramentaria]|uniref:BPTI/Kunitz inhibitor domain-containing protein n=1 Tax=Batillaria attramentaria TaxID=370345 RepID=A0ABD0JGD4_9CAEN
MKTTAVLLCLVTLACLTAAQTNSDCHLPAVPGLCRGYFPRFFYNNRSGKCEEFIYGGCGGNANNFMTEEVCTEACAPTAPTVTEHNHV